ncbi:MAG: hypothetical protein A2Z32_01875, partial [Chloroflexi bacterium RBG_16_69_14]
GLAARRRQPPTDLAAWRPAGDRPDPVVLLEEQAVTRMPDLVPVRYGRMGVSPFTFYRGAALPMAADLAPGPSTGIIVHLCGDAHLSNFGLFASPERAELFDINDFDETLDGPFEWDLQRLAASLVVAGRSRGFSAHENRHAVHRAMRSYRERMAGYAQMRAIDVYYSSVAVASILTYVDKRARPMIETAVRSAAHHDSLHELPKLTTVVGGHRRIVDRPPVIVHRADVTHPLVSAALAGYRETLQEDRRVLLDRYEVVDYAMKVVGVGSVGLGAFAVLLDGGSDDDPLFLQVKEAQASVYERFLGPSGQPAHGARVVSGQRRLQAASDVLLGWFVGQQGRHWYVRQLQDQKASAVVEAMTVEDLATWGELCSWALARGHARSGEPATIAGYLGEDTAFDHAMGSFADAYADQTERDFAAFTAAIKSGRIVGEVGV